MRFNIWLLAAAVLSLVTTGVHVLMGGPEIITPVLATETLSQPVRSVSYVAWHGVTVVLAMTSMMLALAAFKKEWSGRLLWLPLAQYGLFAVLFIAITVKDFGNLFALPQWTAFVAIMILALMGMRKQASYGNPNSSERA